MQDGGLPKLTEGISRGRKREILAVLLQKGAFDEGSTLYKTPRGMGELYLGIVAVCVLATLGGLVARQLAFVVMTFYTPFLAMMANILCLRGIQDCG